MSKARSDSQLKSLAEQSPEFGDKLWDWLHEPKTETCPGGMAYATLQLAADGIELGTAWRRKLSEFRAFWRTRRSFRRAENKAKEAEELLKKLDLGLTQEKISAAGHFVFMEEALEEGNAEEYREMEYLRLSKETARSKGQIEAEKLRQKDAQIGLKKEELALATRRVELLEKKAQEALEAASDTKLSDAQKAARIREIFKK